MVEPTGRPTVRQQREFDVASTDAELDAFTMSRTWADLRMIDGAIDASDRKAPWCYDGEPKGRTPACLKSMSRYRLITTSRSRRTSGVRSPTDPGLNLRALTDRDPVLLVTGGARA